MITFIDACLRDEARPEDINDWIQRWHDNQTVRSDSTVSYTTIYLWEYLGMTSYEYDLWVENPKLIHRIIASRKQEEIDNQNQVLAHVIHEKKQKLRHLKDEFQFLKIEIRDLEKTIQFLEQALKKI